MTPLVEDGVDHVEGDSDPNGGRVAGPMRQAPRRRFAELARHHEDQPGHQVGGTATPYYQPRASTGPAAPSVPEPTAQTQVGAAFTRHLREAASSPEGS